MKTKSIKTIFKKLLFLLLLLPLSIFAQNTFEGIVLDKATKQPLPGVNLNIKGVTRSNTTDFSGIFKLANLKI
ncbi:MAG: TonB-dependent starch-binding outer membrane protein SusC, partial [Bacteroidota bacterium]|nr:TonB-dependent starch-binding outer membrane protein SusC [Bacteroidota bacterium]